MWDHQLQGFMAEKEVVEPETREPELGRQRSGVVQALAILFNNSCNTLFHSYTGEAGVSLY